MLFIYGTDAPLYHYPITTSVMVTINVFVHLLVSQAGIDVTPWILAFGDGLHPLQWLTHNFLHIGWLHLIGNMLFLFPFGLVIEGKIGWWRMLLLYVAIAMGQGLSQQTLMLQHDQTDEAAELVAMFDHPDDPLSEDRKKELIEQYRKDLLKDGFGSLGASAVVFGLLAVCAIWAPQNDFEVFFRWSPLHAAPDGGVREWSVLTVCFIFVAKEVGMFFLLGMSISSEALHLNGFVIGGFFGLAMLYYGLADCEGFDVISMYTGTKFKSPRVVERERKERLAEREANKPQGPPQAVVPKMAHQRQRENSVPKAPTVIKQSPSPAQPKPGPRPSAPSKPLSSTPNLPDFDDGQTKADPLTASRHQAEAMIAKREFSAAFQRVLQLSRNSDAMIAPRSLGQLAEGLIESNQIAQAIESLRIGIEVHPAFAAQWQLRIASLILKHEHDAMGAIRVLREIDQTMLDTKMRQQYAKLGKIAKNMAGR